MARRDRENGRVRRSIGDLVDQPRDVFAPVPDGAGCRLALNVGEQPTAKRCRLRPGRVIAVDTVDVVHHHGIAGVAARLVERAPRQRVLIDQIRQRAVRARLARKREPPIAVECAPNLSQPGEQIVQAFVD